MAKHCFGAGSYIRISNSIQRSKLCKLIAKTGVFKQIKSSAGDFIVAGVIYNTSGEENRN